MQTVLKGGVLRTMAGFSAINIFLKRSSIIENGYVVVHNKSILIKQIGRENVMVEMALRNSVPVLLVDKKIIYQFNQPSYSYSYYADLNYNILLKLNNINNVDKDVHMAHLFEYRAKKI
jgi:hypothetical protein